MADKCCNTCKHLDYMDHEDKDGNVIDSVFVCKAKKYRDEKRKRIHQEQLATEEYRLRPKKCCEWPDA